jgi:1-acyl-sn-glycerol-3-phosphate acyltransferase
MTTADRTTPHPPTGLLRNRNFVLLWSAYGISALGDHLSEMALLKTQNALSPGVDVTTLTARITFMFFLPFLLAPLTGALADRVSRRGLMVTADLVRGAAMITMAAMIAWTSPWGSWGPFAPLLVVGLFAAVFSPARSALLPTLIRPDQLVRANAMLSGLGIIATMAAAKVGGVLADRYDPVIAFRLDAGTFLASAVLLLLLWPPRVETPKRRNAETPKFRLFPISAFPHFGLLGGFHYARSHRHVMELLGVAALVWFCGPLVNSVIPAVVRDVYHGTYSAMSNYRAFLGLGFVLGAILMTLLGDALRGGIAITWGLFGISASIAIFASSVFLPLHPDKLAVIGAVGVILAGMFAVGVMASFSSLLQRTVSDRFRGRVFGVQDLCCTIAILTATGLLGVPGWTRVDRWVGFILVGVAVLMFAAGLVTLSIRLRRGVHGKSLTFAENLNEFLAKFWWRLKRVGPSTVPRIGPVLVTANHTCSADPLFLSAAASYRPISFLVAAEYSTWPVVKFFLRLVECIPVKRDNRDSGATKQAIRHLRDGKAVGIFIEGGIVRPGEVHRPKDGVAMLALRTGAPVIPAYISGVKYHKNVVLGLLIRHRARVRFGPPVDLTEFQLEDRNREVIRAATAKIYAAVKALAPTSEPVEEPNERA